MLLIIVNHHLKYSLEFKTVCCGASRPVFKFLFPHSLAVGSWACFLTSLSLFPQMKNEDTKGIPFHMRIKYTWIMQST